MLRIKTEKQMGGKVRATTTFQQQAITTEQLNNNNNEKSLHRNRKEKHQTHRDRIHFLMNIVNNWKESKYCCLRTLSSDPLFVLAGNFSNLRSDLFCYFFLLLLFSLLFLRISLDLVRSCVCERAVC